MSFRLAIWALARAGGSLHEGLQYALSREFHRRQYEVANKDSLKFSAAAMERGKLASIVFLGEKEIMPSRVQWLEKREDVKAMLSYVAVHLDEPIVVTITGVDATFPLRRVRRELREPLHQNEPADLPDIEAVSWLLAAHYGLDNERPVPRFRGYGPAPSGAPAAGAAAADEAGEADEADEPDEADVDGAGGDDVDCKVGIEDGLEEVEAKELKNLRLLQKKRRDARTGALRQAQHKRLEDGGWVLIAGMWMHPGIINPSMRLGVPVPPRPSEAAAGPAHPGIAGPAALAPAAPPEHIAAAEPAEPSALEPAAAAGAAGPAGLAPAAPPEQIAGGEAFQLDMSCKQPWFGELFSGKKKTEYKKLSFWKVRCIKAGKRLDRIKFFNCRMFVPDRPWFIIKVLSVHEIGINAIPAGEAPAIGTTEFTNLFGDEESVLAISLGEVIESDHCLLPGPPPAPLVAAELRFLCRADSRRLGAALLAGDGWRPWRHDLSAAVGHRLAVTHEGQAIGSICIVESLHVADWKVRVGGYRWVAKKHRSAIDVVAFAKFQSDVSKVVMPMEVHAVNVTGGHAYLHFPLAFEGGPVVSVDCLGVQARAVLSTFEATAPGEMPVILASQFLGFLASRFAEAFGAHLCVRDVFALRALSGPCRGFCINAATGAVGTCRRQCEADAANEFEGNQNSEALLHGGALVLINTIEAPYTHFARAACAAIQLACAHDIFKAFDGAERLAGANVAAAVAVQHVLNGAFAHRCIIKGMELHRLTDLKTQRSPKHSVSEHKLLDRQTLLNKAFGDQSARTRIFLLAFRGRSVHRCYLRDALCVDPATGARQDKEAIVNPGVAKDWYLNPYRLREYLLAMRPEGWESYLDNGGGLLLEVREITPDDSSLDSILGRIDGFESGGLAFFAVIGAGKVFGIVKTCVGIASFDSHQRSVSGEFERETCIGQVACSAASLLVSLSGSYSPDGNFELYVVLKRGIDIL